MEQEIKRNIPRDLFLHLLAIVTLYWSAVSFMTLLLQFINYFSLKTGEFYYGQIQGVNQILVFNMLALIIVFPVFILVSWHLNKIYKIEPAVRESKIRKWLIYLTLFIVILTGVIFFAILILAIYNQSLHSYPAYTLPTSNFLFFISIFLVFILVFVYYLDDVRKDAPTKLAKPFAWISIILFLITIIVAFFIINQVASTTNSFQLESVDNQKIQDLQNIEAQIDLYLQAKKVLPDSISDLKGSYSSGNDFSDYILPADPQTKKSYEYIKEDCQSFFYLCANFNLPWFANLENSNLYTSAPDIQPSDWDHPAGHYCFEREITGPYKEYCPPTPMT